MRGRGLLLPRRRYRGQNSAATAPILGTRGLRNDCPLAASLPPSPPAGSRSSVPSLRRQTSPCGQHRCVQREVGPARNGRGRGRAEGRGRPSGGGHCTSGSRRPRAAASSRPRALLFILSAAEWVCKGLPQAQPSPNRWLKSHSSSCCGVRGKWAVCCLSPAGLYKPRCVSAKDTRFASLGLTFQPPADVFLCFVLLKTNSDSLPILRKRKTRFSVRQSCK